MSPAVAATGDLSANGTLNPDATFQQVGETEQTAEESRISKGEPEDPILSNSRQSLGAAEPDTNRDAEQWVADDIPFGQIRVRTEITQESTTDLSAPCGITTVITANNNSPVQDTQTHALTRQSGVGLPTGEPNATGPETRRSSILDTIRRPLRRLSKRSRAHPSDAEPPEDETDHSGQSPTTSASPSAYGEAFREGPRFTNPWEMNRKLSKAPEGEKAKPAMDIMGAALEANKKEKSKLFLSQDDVPSVSVRERSSSVSHRASSISAVPSNEDEITQKQPSQPVCNPKVDLKVSRSVSTSALADRSKDETPSPVPGQSRRISSTPLVTRPFQPHQMTPRSKTSNLDSPYREFYDEDADMGPWSRYPSHSRAERTGSAGWRDNVNVRDFAFETGGFSVVNAEPVLGSSPTNASHRSSGTLRNRPSNQWSKSLGRTTTALKNYGRMLTEPSYEYHTHGHGHRSSVSLGGHSAQPELDILPAVFSVPPPPPPPAASIAEEVEMRDIPKPRVQWKDLCTDGL